MSKILPFFRAIKSPTIARRMVGIFHATSPEISFLSTTYLEALDIKNLSLYQRFNGYNSCHHASELLFYLLKKSGVELDLKFVNFEQQRHCFLTSEDGKTIIDPTWKQFLSPQKLLRGMTELQYNSSQYREEHEKFCDFFRVDKDKLRLAELDLASENIIFVGSKLEMSKKISDFVKKFNEAYEISSPGLDGKIIDHVESYFPPPQDFTKWQADPKLEYYIDKKVRVPFGFVKFVKEILEELQTTSKQVAQPLAQRLQDESKSQNFSQDI